jgi:DnaJ-domain-containing protein 1
MSSVGRRPTLHELLLALDAIIQVEADASALDRSAKTFRVVLTFRREDCPNDWIEGEPKPTWFIDQLQEEVSAWLHQRNREEQWVSKEEQFGAGIDMLIAHYYEELKKHEKVLLETLLTRSQKQILSNTILRLKELKERREAGGVYSQTESKREKARKAWMEDEFEGPKREEEQRRAHTKANEDEDLRSAAEELLEQMFRSGWENVWRQHHTPPPQPPKSGNKQPWYVTLGVSAHASKDEIKKAYRKLVKQYQPRTSADAEDKARTAKMTEINTARDEGLSGL